MSTGISIFVYNRKAFLALVMMIAALKLFLSAIVPASFDLRDTVLLVSSGHAPVGPWLALYPPLYNQTSNLSNLQAWWLASPSTTNLGMQMTSLLFRLPIFAFDLATGIVIYYTGRSMASPVAGRIASLLWFLNPYSLFSIELLGVPDVLATFLTAVAFSMLFRRRYLLCGVFIGVGVWIKFFPILLLPPLLIFAYRSRISRRKQVAMLVLGLLGLGGYVSWILPGWRTYLTTYTPVAQPLPFIAGESAINGSAFGLILFYCMLLFFARQSKNPIELLLPTLLIYYALSNPAPQYLIWAMPLMALDIAVINPSRSLLFATFYALAYGQWFFTSSAFLTPSGYSLLMIPLAESNPSWSVYAITNLLESYSVTLLLPLLSSALFACGAIYAVDIARSWFNTTSLVSKGTLDKP